MADKKDKDKRFQQNPFRGLKGFCVSTQAEKGSTKKEENNPGSSPVVEDEAAFFEAEMARLGMVCGEAEAESMARNGEEEKDLSPPTPSSDRELFLEALKGIDTVFADELPPTEEPQASPRRMKLLRKGRLSPEAKLDLHGLSREEARGRVGCFLDDALYQGKKVVLIVTGRGKGSGAEPVLRAEVERYLTQDVGALISEWGRAPRRYGGEGALVVFLKGRKKDK